MKTSLLMFIFWAANAHASLPFGHSNNVTFLEKAGPGREGIDVLIDRKLYTLDRYVERTDEAERLAPRKLEVGNRALSSPRFQEFLDLITKKLGPGHDEVIALLSQVPDPDRWFLLSFLMNYQFVIVDSGTMRSLLPVELRENSENILSYRLENTVYLLDGYPKLTHNILLPWLAFKEWANFEVTTEAQLAGYFRKFLETLSTDPFKIRGKDDLHPLRFHDWLPALSKDFVPLDRASYHLTPLGSGRARIRITNDIVYQTSTLRLGDPLSLLQRGPAPNEMRQSQEIELRFNGAQSSAEIERGQK